MIRDAIGHKFKIFHSGDYGIEIETECKEQYDIPSGFFWDVPRYEAGHPNAGEPKPEQSLRDFGVEYVLRVPVSYDQLGEALAEFTNMMKGKKLITDSISTSVHVHKNILNETFQTVGNFLTLYTLVENILMEYAGEFRRHNLFCLPICDTPVTHQNIMSMFTGAANYKYGNWFLDVNAVKYGALNLSSIGHYGSVEMRQLSGDPDPMRIRTWVDLIQKMIVFSRQNIIPSDILDFYKLQGSQFLKDVFGNNSSVLNLEDHQELIVAKKNLWFAGQIAYVLDNETWRKLDTFPVKTHPSIELVEAASIHVFNAPLDKLSVGQNEYLYQWLDANPGWKPQNKDKNMKAHMQNVQKLVNAQGAMAGNGEQLVNWKKLIIGGNAGVVEVAPPQPQPIGWEFMHGAFGDPVKKKMPLAKKPIPMPEGDFGYGVPLKLEEEDYNYFDGNGDPE